MRRERKREREREREHNENERSHGSEDRFPIPVPREPSSIWNLDDPAGGVLYNEDFRLDRLGPRVQESVARVTKL